MPPGVCLGKGVPPREAPKTKDSPATRRHRNETLKPHPRLEKGHDAKPPPCRESIRQASVPRVC